MPSGYKVLGYVEDNFGGNYVTFTSDNNCLGGWDNVITSIRVRANGAGGKNGTYSLRNRNSNKYMDVAGGNTADGTNILQWTGTGRTNQQFTFTDVGNGTYKIINVATGKAVDVAGGSTNNAGNVLQWTYGGGPNQQFILIATDNNYYKLKAAHSGRLVEVYGRGLNNDDNVDQFDDNNQNNGQWQLVAIGSLKVSGTSLNKTAGIDSVADTDAKVISVFPNPATGLITLTNVPGNTTVTIFDVKGKARLSVKSSAKGGVVKEDVSHLKAGTYFIRVGNDSKKTLKLLKQ